MDPLIPYNLSLKGMKDGQHQFSFDVDGSFFQAFEASPIAQANLKMDVALDKKERFLVLDFSFSGTVQSTCDRCLASINLPVKGDNQLIVKYGEIEIDHEEDVIYIPKETGIWSIAQYVYEYILLASPLIKMYDCEDDDPIPCDLAMLDRLDETYAIEDEAPKVNPFGEALKDWNK